MSSHLQVFHTDDWQLLTIHIQEDCLYWTVHYNNNKTRL
jgi:hypothetical protein